MEITMSGEEIREEILKHQVEIQKCLAKCCGKFELNDEIVQHKKSIDKLRNECPHVQKNGASLFTANGKCAFCGKQVK